MDRRAIHVADEPDPLVSGGEATQFRLRLSAARDHERHRRLQRTVGMNEEIHSLPGVKTAAVQKVLEGTFPEPVGVRKRRV
jgi:hypothetical protein